MLNVQGQSRAVMQLQRALRSGRLASTWIFAGPLGVGKFLLAVEFAKTVLCDRPVDRANRDLETPVAELPAEFLLRLPCGVCESCRAVAVGNHPDLHVITKELKRMYDTAGKSKVTTMAIEVIRAEITGDAKNNREAKIGKRPVRGRGKFFIIDEADLMEAGAQNALLKSLEEPPASGGGSFLILVTTSPGELLATIRSRSQIVEFGELPEEVIVKAMVGRGLSREDAGLMARLARGSLGRALHWAGDIELIDKKNGEAAERAAKAAERGKAKAAAVEVADEDEGSTNKFTPGGILTWTRELGGMLDQLVAGRCGGSDVAALMARFAAEFSGLHLQHDKLASADRAKRDGIALMMAIAAEWFSDRLRQGLGVPHEVMLPAESGGVDYGVVPALIASAREAEWQIDMNANDKIVLAATATRWEELLHASG